MYQHPSVMRSRFGDARQVRHGICAHDWGPAVFRERGRVDQTSRACLSYLSLAPCLRCLKHGSQVDVVSVISTLQARLGHTLLDSSVKLLLRLIIVVCPFRFLASPILPPVLPLLL